MIQAVIFVLAAVRIIYRPEWKLVDPITTFVFAVLVIGWHMLPFSLDCMKVLMELAPENLNSKELTDKIQNVSFASFHHILA